MASTGHFLFFTGFIVVFLKLVASGSLYEYGVERSSVNPLSYTEEIRYSRDRTTQSPLFGYFRRSLNCPENEHFASCNFECQKTCENYNENIRCPRACAWGCVCNLGLVRGPNNKCIEPKDCPSKTNAETQHSWCKRYEIWDFMYAHCQRNCSNYDDVLRCRKIYVAGCVCDYPNGYVRGANGNCIKIEECPNKPYNYSSQENVYEPDIYKNTYVTPDPLSNTDDNYHMPETRTKSPHFATENPGYEETLIPPLSHKKFPHKCSEPRQRWVTCFAHCQRNCNNKDDKNFFCRPVCISGCVCQKGLVMGPDGTCIEKNKCPSISDSETNSDVTLNPPPYTDDDYHIPSSGTKSLFDSETDNPQYQETEDSSISPTSFYATLNPTYYTDGDNIISETNKPQFEGTELSSILETDPSHECPSRERYVPCGGHCQRNCSNKDDDDFGCRPVCIPGCICEEGLVRGSDGKCIEKDKCPLNSDSEWDDITHMELITANNGLTDEEEDQWRKHWADFEVETQELDNKTEDPSDNFSVTRDDRFEAGYNPCLDDNTC